MNQSQKLHEIAREEEGKLLLELVTAIYKANGISEKCFFLDYSGHVEAIGFRVSESKKIYNNRLLDEMICEADGHEKRWNTLNLWLNEVNKHIAEALKGADTNA